MPLVPERPLSYGEVQDKNRRMVRTKNSPGSKSFPKVDWVRTGKNHNSGYVKTKLGDKSLISDDITNRKHLRTISREDS